jgi:T4 RnlA family RNA ligase
MKYSLNILNKYIEDGLVVKQDHPSLPLSIYNYSRTCQYEGKWDNVTMTCRGLILDDKGNVVAKAFPKFFNMEELDSIPNELFTVTEKLDGSLGIAFHYNGEWHFASKGSFTSEQAIKGKQLLDKENTEYGMIPGYTYLFEIIYPENRIVVDYGGVEKLIVIGVYNNETGNEGSIDNMVSEGFEVVKRYDGINDYKALKQMIDPNQEGYVIRFRSGMRMKIKGEEYVRLHRILTNFSSKDIWELMMNGDDLEPFLERVPDEFDKWVRDQIKSFEYGKYSIREYCGKIHDYFRYGKYNDVDPEPTKKDFALHLEKGNVLPGHRSVCFAMWDGKPYDHIIWKLMKPKYEKPFWSKEEA